MRQVSHPERLFIQINDEDSNTLSFSFNDDLENPEGLDPNAFDKPTLLRVTQMLANVFMCVEKLRTNGKEIKNIDI